jgi:hypothetical protein
MAFIRITKDNIENHTLILNPLQTYSSSTAGPGLGPGGITGSVKLFPRASDSEKEILRLGAFNERNFVDDDLASAYKNIKITENDNGITIVGGIHDLMEKINSSSISVRKKQALEIHRFVPTVKFTQNTLRKNVVRNILMPFYRSSMPTAHWGYTNYHTLNFFTASSVPSQSAILYPNSASEGLSLTTSGSYVLGGEFTFDFYINPRYHFEKAGTLFHLSSSYAVSLVTGTMLSDEVPNEREGFRIMLQLSHSVDTKPSRIAVTGSSNIVFDGNYPNNLVFLSDDNSLRRNHWHHVAIRWGTSATDHGTGSFIIDGDNAGTFHIPSATIAPKPFNDSGNPSVLCIGNYLEGDNSGVNTAHSLFFRERVANREGVPLLLPGSDTEDPNNVVLDHPLNAEVHDLKIYDTFRSLSQIYTSSLQGTDDFTNLKFYVPPLFTKESPTRTQVGETGGVFITPFQTYDGETNDPFNVDLSFGVGGFYLNLENFTRDFATGHYPRLLYLTGAQITATSEELSALQFLYTTGSVRKRSLSVLPCDNGRFLPNYDLLKTGSTTQETLNPPTTALSGSILEKYTNDFNTVDFSLISLTNMYDLDEHTYPGLAIESGSIINKIVGASPEDYTAAVPSHRIPTILQRTRDNTSNEVIFFDISNVYYGKTIVPKSFKITDSYISGSDGYIGITLKDDGMGNIYRADAKTKHATWNSVGNIFYNEGIVLIKTPNIPFFGKDQFDIELKGETEINVLKFNLPIFAQMLNSSSNPNYVELTSSLAHEKKDPYVIITGINYHDKDLNVVMRTHLAQPLYRKSGDKVMFRTKIDF